VRHVEWQPLCFPFFFLSFSGERARNKRRAEYDDDGDDNDDDDDDGTRANESILNEH